MIAQFEFSFHYVVCRIICWNLSRSKIRPSNYLYISYKYRPIFQSFSCFLHLVNMIGDYLKSFPKLRFLLFWHCYFNRLRYFEKIRFSTSFSKINFAEIDLVENRLILNNVITLVQWANFVLLLALGVVPDCLSKCDQVFYFIFFVSFSYVSVYCRFHIRIWQRSNSLQ